MTQARNEQPSHSILLVDDDLPSRIAAADVLASHGFEVHEAGSGEDALREFTAQRPDAVLLDVLMPGIDGFETCRRMRAVPGGENCPIVILTGYEDQQTLQRAFDAGATDFATKPIPWLALSHRLRHLIRGTELVGQLKESEALLARAQRIAGLGHWEFDMRSGAIMLSAEARRLIGLSADEHYSVARYFAECHVNDRRRVMRALLALTYSTQATVLEHRVIASDGSSIDIELHLEPTAFEAGRPQRLIGTVQDVTQRKRDEEQIRRLAFFDALTELPNRAMFSRFLGSSLATARRRGTSVAVLFLDLDDFKKINDSLGHSAGDCVLQEVAQRLRLVIRHGDEVARVGQPASDQAVARLGGDEFIVALVDVTRAEDAATAAQRVIEALRAPIVIGDSEVYISGSIGISLFPQDGESVEDLLKQADLAMYHAKDTGKNDFHFYSERMNAAAFQRLSLESQLRRAIERQELRLFLQPKVDLRNGQIVGAESLLRWEHPDLGQVPPDRFIPLAEQTGLIVPIGEWVLQRATALLREWFDGGLGELSIAINLSGRHFHHKSILDHIRAAVMTSGIPPERVVIEVTESVLMNDAATTIGVLHDLKAMGLRLSVDDFGTGYSSLAYLRRFPLDELKIDRSFVRALEHSPDDRVIVEAIIGLAQRLGLEVVAEGVEQETQRRLLTDAGCHLMQGYLFGRPCPVETFKALLVKSAAIGGVRQR